MDAARVFFSLRTGRHLAVTGTAAGVFVGLWFISGVLEQTGVLTLVKWGLFVVCIALGAPLLLATCYDACLRPQKKGGGMMWD